MDSLAAVTVFAALAQDTRLNAFRCLVRHEPTGLAAGDLARMVGVPQNTLSAHLAILARADLVTQARQSRSIIYRAKIKTVSDLAFYMVMECCLGSNDACSAERRNLFDQCLATTDEQTAQPEGEIP